MEIWKYFWPMKISFIFKINIGGIFFSIANEINTHFHPISDDWP